MGSASDGGAIELCLHRVFSSSLDAKKSWYALNSSLCCCKPSMFCSTEFAKVSPDEYRQFNSSEVFGEDGAPASARWFSSDGRHSEKVHVCTTFGFVLGILRQKSFRQVQFLKTEHFKAVVSWINSFDLERASEAPKAENQPIFKSPPNTDLVSFCVSIKGVTILICVAFFFFKKSRISCLPFAVKAILMLHYFQKNCFFIVRFLFVAEITFKHISVT